MIKNDQKWGRDLNVRDKKKPLKSILAFNKTLTEYYFYCFNALYFIQYYLFMDKFTKGVVWLEGAKMLLSTKTPNQRWLCVYVSSAPGTYNLF